MTRTGIRLLSALLLLIMLPGAGAASAEAMPARDAWAIEKAKALAARMQVLAGDGQYIQLYMAQPAEGQDALLDALRPFLSAERRRRLDRALRLARLASLASLAGELGALGGEESV